jgi:hypothetical protein
VVVSFRVAARPCIGRAMTATNGANRLSNVGVAMTHVFSRNPLYADLLVRCRREDRRLSLIEYEQQAVWVPVSWLDDLKGKT